MTLASVTLAVWAPDSAVASASYPPVVAQEEARKKAATRNSDVLREFKRQVDAYRKLREQAEAKTGPLPKTGNPAAITKRQLAFAEAIRAARANAQQGDVFTPRVADMLKRIVAGDLRRRRPVDRQAFIVSQPDTTVQVNGSYPTTVPLATVPPRLLAALPPLPEDLEYRFVNGALILHDVDANLVVDVLPDVVPAPDRER